MSSDVEEACPIIQLLDSDHEEDSEIEINRMNVGHLLKSKTMNSPYIFLLYEHRDLRAVFDSNKIRISQHTIFFTCERQRQTVR